MIIVDTDALSHIQKKNLYGKLIGAWLDASSDRETRITAVTVYEVVRGAVDLLKKAQKERRGQIPAFSLVQELVEFLADWKGRILPFDEEAERIYQALPARLRQELKDDARIAAIALANGAAVWTCNVADHARVPGLTVHDARTGLPMA